MNYLSVAEKQIKKEHKNFEAYKKTEEFKIELEERARKIQKTYESRRNTRIRELAESKNLPKQNDVADKTVEHILNLIKIEDLAIMSDNGYFRKPLKDIPQFEVADILDNPTLSRKLCLYDSRHIARTIKEMVSVYTKELWLTSYRELNPFKKSDSRFMNNNGNMISVSDALNNRYGNQKANLEDSILKAFNSNLIIEAMVANEKYPHLRDAREFRNKLNQMMSEAIPADYTMFYPLARSMHRHFILHIGPTNSGKTYDAIADLMSAQSGIYLAPLRLLALENQEKLNSHNIPCNLYTGEEQILVENACHTSSTIETLSLERKYDVAVIDETQMIADEQRGWAWTRAILGVRANVIHVCMSPDAERIVKKLVEMCDDTWEVVEHKREMPLIVEGSTFNFPSGVRKHDALIVFSRRSVWEVAAELERKNTKVSVIYGALPPSVRKEEVRKFVDGETSVVVATDAIGMGLNLPIKRVVFLETEKFDGKTRRPLNHKEYKQIAGRAGRRGIFDTGYVSSLSARKEIRKGIDVPYHPIERARITFPESLLTIDAPLIEILKRWKKVLNTNVFEKADIEKEIMLCGMLDKKGYVLSKKEMLDRVQIPFNHEDPKLLNIWRELVDLEYNDDFNVNKYPLPKGFKSDPIQDLEYKYRVCDLLFAFARVVGCSIDELNIIMDAKYDISNLIIAKLKENKKNHGKKCKSCGKPLPFNFGFGYCERCYDDMRNRWWNDEDYYW